ncbi:hypothetical protein GCM10012275_56590 [Longimycelium tulufanense]|uniref:Uncharacterized protein n=1 Tax=Longimycelium tulufanense TaxID=907463 RepID=A0A8J3CDK5_9PSEU|nr:hypothetical protein [Longimycelium tulufanense]GGM78632.1 hypothetical protein GCM10012275_56590 [Longimycelium tulufanense]
MRRLNRTERIAILTPVALLAAGVLLYALWPDSPGELTPLKTAEYGPEDTKLKAHLDTLSALEWYPHLRTVHTASNGMTTARTDWANNPDNRRAAVHLCEVLGSYQLNETPDFGGITILDNEDEPLIHRWSRDQRCDQAVGSGVR